MDYTLAGIRNRVLVDKLDDEEFDPDVVDRFINDTERDVFNEYELPFQEKVFSGNVPSGITMFNFPADVAQIQSLVVTAPDQSQRNIMNGEMDFRSFTKVYPTPLMNPSGPITYWALHGNVLMTSTPTDQEYTLTTYYIRKPGKLVENEDVPGIPEEFGELLVLGAFMRIQKRNEDYDQAAITEQDYNNQLNLLVARYGFRTGNGPIKMKNQQIVYRNRR